jgi:hypothetical protein
MKKQITEESDIIVILPDSGFTQLPRATTQNPDLTLAESGLLAHLCSFPPDWNLRKKNMMPRLPKEKIGTFNRAWKGLQSKGYIVSKQMQDNRGHFKKWKHTVYAILPHNQPISLFTQLGKNEYTSDTQS